MSVVYKLKDNVDLNEFAKLGYDITDEGNVIFTIVKQPIDGVAADYLLTNFYNNPDWKKRFYKGNEKLFKEKIGLEYDEKGKIIMNEQIETVLTEWILLVDSADADETNNGKILMGFANRDPFDKHVFYGAKLLKKQCGEEIQKLLDKDLIEEYEELPIA